MVFDLFELDDDVTDEIDDDLKSLDHDDDAQSLDDLKNLYNAPVTEEAEFEDFDDFFADLGIGEPDNSEKKT
ncbi:MAG: hypothetical protein GQ582_01820 [Methyloprofundus sp.]|nr:hypothetical protein [Methyloprofundus sp.]